MHRKIFPVLALILLPGCSMLPAAEQEPTAAALVDTAVPAMEPTATWTASPEPPPPSTATIELPPPPPQPATAVEPLLAAVQVRRINVRRGPGTVFPVLDSLEEGDQVVVIGKALGEEWVKVQVPAGEEGEAPVLTGWLLAEFLELSTPVEYLGYTDVPDAWLVEGKVLEESGSPVDGVGIAITQGLGADELRTDTFTLENGRFYAYLPEESVGIWQVEATGLRCESRLMLDSCELQAGYYLSIPRVNIVVPNETPVLLLFSYSEGGLFGTVYVDGKVKEGVRVRGDSSSGAFSWAFTDGNGRYALALGEGVWTVYAVDDSSGDESDSMTVALGAGQRLSDVDLVIR